MTGRMFRTSRTRMECRSLFTGGQPPFKFNMGGSTNDALGLGYSKTKIEVGKKDFNSCLAMEEQAGQPQLSRDYREQEADGDLPRQCPKPCLNQANSPRQSEIKLPQPERPENMPAQSMHVANVMLRRLDAMLQSPILVPIAIQPGSTVKCPHLVVEGELPFPFSFPFLPVLCPLIDKRIALTFI